MNPLRIWVVGLFFQDLQRPGLLNEGAFSPSNVTMDLRTDHERGLPKTPDTKWSKRPDWHKQAVAAVREERQLAREAEARRAGAFG